MKRPLVFKLVATWCLFGLLIQTGYFARPSRAYRAAGEPVPPLWDILPVLALVFLIWQTAGLVQLRPFNRWFAVVFCAWWAVALVWNAALALARPTVKLVPALTFFSIFITFNLLSAWYLSRRRFREFAVQFAAQRELANAKHSPLMQKVAQKRILKDIRSMKIQL